MKKFISPILVLVLIMMILSVSACGNQTGKEAQSEDILTESNVHSEIEESTPVTEEAILEIEELQQ